MLLLLRRPLRDDVSSAHISGTDEVEYWLWGKNGLWEGGDRLRENWL